MKRPPAPLPHRRPPGQDAAARPPGRGLAAAGLLCLSLSCATAAPKPPAPAPETPTPASRSARTPWDMPSRPQLPREARELLAGRMERHADQMAMLMFSVVLLNYPAAEALAEEVSREPRLLAPGEGEEGTLASALPARLFTLEEAFARQARTVRDAARAQDEDALVKGFGALTGTCVACHSAFLYEELEPGFE